MGELRRFKPFSILEIGSYQLPDQRLCLRHLCPGQWNNGQPIAWRHRFLVEDGPLGDGPSRPYSLIPAARTELLSRVKFSPDLPNHTSFDRLDLEMLLRSHRFEPATRRLLAEERIMEGQRRLFFAREWIIAPDPGKLVRYFFLFQGNRRQLKLAGSPAPLLTGPPEKLAHLLGVSLLLTLFCRLIL